MTFSTCVRTCRTTTTYSCRISSARSQLAVGPSGKSTRVGTRAGPWNYFWVIYRGLKKSSPIFHPLSGYFLENGCDKCDVFGLGRWCPTIPSLDHYNYRIFFFLCRTVAVKRYRTQARFMKSEVEMFCREVSPLLTKK